MRDWIKVYLDVFDSMVFRAAQIVVPSLLMLFTQLGWGQADAAVAVWAPDKNSYLENYDEHIDVAGQVRAGLMYASRLDKVDIEKLTIDLSLLEPTADEIACFRVASRNGVFSATWRITLEQELLDEAKRKDSAGSAVVSNFPSKHKAILEQFPPDELVAIVSVVPPAQECAVAGRSYLPTSWGVADRRRLVAYLNADSTEALIAGKVAAGVIKENCVLLPSTDDNIAFDTVCTLNLAADSDDEKAAPEIPNELIVLRKNFSTVMKKLSYPLSTAN